MDGVFRSDKAEAGRDLLKFLTTPAAVEVFKVGWLESVTP
jgi:hypothetical protein